LVVVGIEAGGTTFKVAISSLKPNDNYTFADILHMESFATTEPQETLPNVTQWVRNTCQEHHYKIERIGIACFGPIDLDKSSKTYGYITSTPKLKWQQCDILGHMKRQFSELPDDRFSFDTDVNAPANSELNHYNVAHPDKKISSIAYITVGTGIGVGLVVNGRTVHGLVHPEGGHLYVPLHESDLKENFKGTCPFHGSCVEGMASAGSIAARKKIANAELSTIDDRDESWDRVSHYLAHLCVSISLLTSVERIVISGGVLKRKILYPIIREKFKDYMNGYMKHKILIDDVAQYIVGSEFGDNAGIIGALCLKGN